MSYRWDGVDIISKNHRDIFLPKIIIGKTIGITFYLSN